MYLFCRPFLLWHRMREPADRSAELRQLWKHLPCGTHVQGNDLQRRGLRYSESEQWDGLHARRWVQWGLLQRYVRPVHRARQLPCASGLQGCHVRRQPVWYRQRGEWSTGRLSVTGLLQWCLLHEWASLYW